MKVTRTVNNGDDHDASLGSRGINFTIILILHGLSVLIPHGLHQFNLRCVTNIRAGLDRRGISNLWPQRCGMLSQVCSKAISSLLCGCSWDTISYKPCIALTCCDFPCQVTPEVKSLSDST
jgi:hypothetical protein